MARLKIKVFGIVLLLCLLLVPGTSRSDEIHRYADNSSQKDPAEAVTFVWPAPNSHYLTSGFGNRKIALYGYERLHTGVDIHTAVGDPVLAIADGTVLVSVYDGGWGEYLIINHGDNLVSLYAHLDSRSVSRGDKVTAGQQIGTSGNSGLSSGPHLHFELRQNGKSINPFRYTYN